MDKHLFVGIDVSAESLEIAFRASDGRSGRGQFDNDAPGHRKLVSFLRKFRLPVRIVLEATGTYGLDVALALEQVSTFEVMVANPRAVADFAKAELQRSKTDRADAGIILLFAQRMTFVRWTRPSSEALEARALTRRALALTEMKRAEQNRRHATDSSSAFSTSLRKSVDAVIRTLDEQIAQLRAKAIAAARRDPVMSRRLDLLVSVKGIGQVSAIGILTELSVLPADMTDRQWVAHAGLDPRIVESGKSVRKKTRISKAGNKYLRAILYLPAVVAIQRDPHVKAFAQHLGELGKAPRQIHVAVMRKMLHAINAMFRTDTPFDNTRFYRTSTEAAVDTVGTSEIAPFAISEVSTVA